LARRKASAGQFQGSGSDETRSSIPFENVVPAGNGDRIVLSTLPVPRFDCKPTHGSVDRGGPKLFVSIIDVGIWYQASFPTLPSRRVDYASFLKPNVKISGDRNMKTAITDFRDIGPYVAKIITDDRTVKKFVLCYGELLSQEEIFAKMEELSEEKIERQYVRLLLSLFSSL
jgi:hypothetical protein